MKIGLITPAPAGSRHGNRVTALRWARILRSLNHVVVINKEYVNEGFDLLIALHARKSYQSIRRFSERRPDSPLVVALTGTDLYRDLKRSSRVWESLDLATRLVVLQPLALRMLMKEHRQKAGVIYQSAPEQLWKRLGRRSRGARRSCEVAVVGHLRPVKDPFRAAMAARLLPETSRVRIVHAGAAMSDAMARRAIREMEVNPRYRWVGDLSPGQVWRLLERAALSVLSSKSEGGANVLSESIVAGVPVVASRIPGSVGILGRDYPGYFEVGDAKGLADLMYRAECDDRFISELARRCRGLVPLFDPRREAEAWRRVLAGFCE